MLTSTFPRWENDVEPPFVYELCRRLADSGCSIDVLAPHAPGSNTREKIAGLCVYRYRYSLEKLEKLAYEGGIMASLKQHKWRYLLVPGFLLAQLCYTRKLLKSGDYDLVHAHWIIPQGLIAVLALKLIKDKKPALVVTSHGGDLFALSSGLFTRLKIWTLKSLNRLIVVSQFMKSYCIKHLTGEVEIDVCSMGVDLTHRFVPATVSTQRSNRLIFVGRLVEKKGVVYLVKAMRLLIDRGQDVFLDIIGDGPEKTTITKLIKQLQLEQHVTLQGAIKNSELPGYYHRAGIAVIPSIVDRARDQEGLGLTAVEAMGCECVVIASALEAIKDVVIDGETGLLCTPANEDKLADKIQELLGDHARQQALAGAGRQHVLARFDWQQVSNRYRQLYEKSINSHADRE